MLIWMRAETRANEDRAPLTPDGAAEMIAAGYRLCVERSDNRCFSDAAYEAAGCEMVAAGAWTDAPGDAVILGLKELPEDGTPLRHRHIMFGHAYKAQAAGRVLLDRFKAGGGTLLDLEYLVDGSGRRVAAFGYWAGYAGAAVALMGWGAAEAGGRLGPVSTFASATDMADRTKAALKGATPSAIIIGALGRVGSGAADLCEAVGVVPTRWDMAETAHGGPYPEVLDHDVFLNCILAQDGVAPFVPADAGDQPRRLSMIGDIACDPDSPFNPVPVYSAATTWAEPVVRVHDTPPLDVMAIDNLPSMLPKESTEDFASQLLPHLLALKTDPDDVWARAEQMFRTHV